MKATCFFPSLLLTMFVQTAVYPQKKALKSIEWEKIASLPQTHGKPAIGVAGPVNQVYGNFLIVAGGANFPDKKPWEGGKKHYSDEVHILQKKKGVYSWTAESPARLPEPIAYCGNTSTALGIVYAGGENERGLSDKAYLLKPDRSGKKVTVQSLPSLPLPLTNIALTHIGNTVYAAGGDGAILSSARFFSLDLEKRASKWEILPDMPAPLANAVLMAQESPEGLNIYVAGGRSKHPSGISELRSSLFIYNPRNRSWTIGADISEGLQPINYSAGTGVPFSNRFLVLLGGDNGEVFHQIETYLSGISKAKTEDEKTRLIARKNELLTAHQGFYTGILVYDTHFNTWAKIGDLPFLPRVTTTAAVWGKHIILSNGEIKPGVRDPSILLGRIEK